jgi:hypothetical protein
MEAPEGLGPVSHPRKWTREEELEQLLDIAAVYLTENPESTFSEEELLEQMRELSFDAIEVSLGDVHETICRTGTVIAAAGGRWRLR